MIPAKGYFSTMKSDSKLLKNDPGNILTVEKLPGSIFNAEK